MKIDIPLNVFRHVLRGLNDNPNVIELGIAFQISGKDRDDGYIIRNGCASIMLDSDFPYVSYNGTKFDMTSWFDADISYYDDIIDPNMDSIFITYCNIL
jgi:hypothetical protein